MARHLTLEELVAIIGEELPKFIVALFDKSASITKTYFQDRNEVYDPTLASPMIRYHVRQGLRTAAGVAFKESGNGFFLEKPYNLGIWFEFEGLSFRAYKVRKGGTPLEGENCSEARLRHFNNEEPLQRHLGAEPWESNADVLWSIDKHGDLVEMRIVVPDGFDDGQLKLALAYPLPTNTVEMQRHFTPTSDEEIQIDRKDDLTVDKQPEIKDLES